MFGLLTRDNPLVMVAKEKGKHGHKLLGEILIFILVSIITCLIEAIPYVVFGISEGMKLVSQGITDIAKATAAAEAIFTGTWFTLLSLAITAVAIGVSIFYCTVIEKRPIKTMGFVKRGGRDYAEGLFVGLLMFLAVVIIGWLINLTGIGGFKFNGISSNISPMILLFLVGYLIQGMSEEVVSRGYFMVSAARANKLAAAVIASSVIFSLMHIANNGFTVLAAVNVFLFGFLMAIYMLKTGSIWGVAAIHSAWNFLQGNIFGFSVSGTKEMSSVFSFSVSGYDFISGGEFGPEGGLVVTVVLLVSIFLVLNGSKSKKKF